MTNMPPTEISDKALDLLQRPLTCALITVMPDGQPQATPVWFDFDGENIRFNTAAGRQKVRNMERDSKVTISIIDPQNPFHWLEWRGHIAEVRDESQGAREHVTALHQRYTGQPPSAEMFADEQRLMYIVAPDKVNAH